MIKYHVEIEDWMTTCGDGCCTDYGCSIYVNEINITNYFQEHDVEAWEKLFKALGVEGVLVTYKSS